MLIIGKKRDIFGLFYFAFVFFLYVVRTPIAMARTTRSSSASHSNEVLSPQNPLLMIGPAIAVMFAVGDGVTVTLAHTPLVVGVLLFIGTLIVGVGASMTGVMVGVSCPGVSVGTGITLGAGVGVAVGVIVGSGVAVGTGVGVRVGVDVGVGVAVGPGNMVGNGPMCGICGMFGMAGMAVGTGIVLSALA
jgi:hypothetical protein